MPQAGQTMEEGTVVMWHVQQGDIIEKGQIIFEIETDKAAFEVEADHTGRLAKIVVFEGETVPVKTPVAYIADNDADIEKYIAAQSTAINLIAGDESNAHQHNFLCRTPVSPG